MADPIIRIPRWEKGLNGFKRKANAQLAAIEVLSRAPRAPQQVFQPPRPRPILLAKITEIGTTAGTYKATQVRADGSAPTTPIVWDGASGNRPVLNLQSGGYGPAINKVVKVTLGADASGNPWWYFRNDQPFLAIITGSTAFGERWKYAWSEAELGTDTISTLSGGRSGTTASGYALNTAEVYHTATYAWGVDVTGTDYAATSAEPRPVGGGGTADTHRYNVPVWMYETVVAGAWVYWFGPLSGSHDGACS